MKRKKFNTNKDFFEWYQTNLEKIMNVRVELKKDLISVYYEKKV